jgi:hypothetical protein
MVEGARNYASCVGCHSADGSGQAAAGIPPLARSEWVTGSDERLALILLHGVGGPIEVSGKLYNNPAMQVSIAAGMTDRQIASIMTYIRNSWGNSAPVVMLGGVAHAREQHSGRTSFWTAAELLEQIPDGQSLPGSEAAGGDIEDGTEGEDPGDAGGAEGDDAGSDLEQGTSGGDQARSKNLRFGHQDSVDDLVSQLETGCSMAYLEVGVGGTIRAVVDADQEAMSGRQTGAGLQTYCKIEFSSLVAG